jgi:hypothetical protein
VLLLLLLLLRVLQACQAIAQQQHPVCLRLEEERLNGTQARQQVVLLQQQVPARGRRQAVLTQQRLREQDFERGCHRRGRVLCWPRCCCCCCWWRWWS